MEVLLSYNVHVNDALLHAINEESVEAVEILLKHEDRMRAEAIAKLGDTPTTTEVCFVFISVMSCIVMLFKHSWHWEFVMVLLV